jgi:hypothetical protein
VRPIVLKNLDVIRLTQPDIIPVQEAQQFDQREIARMQKRHTLLDPVVKTYAGAVNDRRFLEHLLYADIDRMPVAQEAPLGKRLGAGVMPATGARSQDKNANFCHI